MNTKQPDKFYPYLMAWQLTLEWYRDESGNVWVRRQQIQQTILPVMNPILCYPNYTNCEHMNTKYQPDNEKECTNCGRPVYSGLPRCAKCQTVYLDGYDEGFNDGIKAGQRAFESTFNMIFGKAETK